MEYQPDVREQRYVVYDGKPGPIYAGNDLGQLILRLNEQLEQGKSSIVMEFAGVSGKEGRAIKTELSVQQELIRASSAWIPLTLASQKLLERYQQPGMVLETMILTKENTPGDRERGRRAIVELSDGKRDLWVQMRFAHRILADKFMGIFLGTFLEQFLPQQAKSSWSVSNALKLTRRQLKANHPELSHQQIGIDLRYEIANTSLGEIFIARATAA
jgi:hypothetical protein